MTARSDPSKRNAAHLSSVHASPKTGVDSQQPRSSLGMPSAQPNHSNTFGTTPSLTDRGVRKPKGWHRSWLRISKSAASTQVARENIMASDTKKTDSSGNSDSRSTKTLRSISETNSIEASSIKQSKGANAGDSSGQIASNNEATTEDHTSDESRADNHNLDEPHESTHATSEDVVEAPVSATGWLSWLGISAATQIEDEHTNDNAECHKSTLGTTQEIQAQDSEHQLPQPSPTVSTPQPPEAQVPVKSTSSWFGLWSSSADPTTQESAERIPKEDDRTDTKANEHGHAVVQDGPVPLAPAPVPETTQQLAGSTWAFWSRDTTSRKANEPVSAEQGELAVIGDGSESRPRASSVTAPAEGSSKQKESLTKSSKEELAKDTPIKKTKISQSQTMDIDQPSPGTSRVPIALPSKSATASVHKVTPPNLLLPSFKSTYRRKENPPIIKQITQLLLRTQQPPTKHVFLSNETPRIKKAIAIGIHGLFPASYLRPMIGQPTGTSIRFANHCAEAIRRWADSNGSGDCEIEKVALEGEGKISERVDNLWTLLLNWIEHIKTADLVMLACHSQGVPVGIMLLEKLIDLGVVANSRIGICAMAGVSLGPFPDYNRSGMGMLMGSVAELWQFADPESEISKRYEHALKTVVDHGARITYVGSIDDQLVPLESALYGPASHPYIYRAVFIDGRIHAPDFIAHLVGLALKLRNLGISDHGLVRELSVPLAGSLYTGGGHSSLYDDGQVYDLAILHTLETTNLPGVPCQVEKHQGLANPNPYVLPWIMRGLIEEEVVKTELHLEKVELLKQFEDWTPATKALKDVKYRLEAVRSKL